MKDTEAIALPPLRPPERRGARVPIWLWAVVVPLVLVLGFAGGWWFQRGGDDSGAGKTGGELAAVAVAVDGAAVAPSSEGDVTRIPELLTTARLAMADEDWQLAEKHYEQVLAIDPENSEAQATLPKIADRLEAQRGTLVVDVQPVGATVTLAGESMKQVDAESVTFDAVPIGSHELEIVLTGYEPVLKQVVIKHGEVLELAPVVLEKSAGSLKVSSQPAGVNYLVRRLSDDAAEDDRAANGGEVVVRGTTPANLPELSVGRYEIAMSQKGWPEHREVVTVRNSRETNVSHVFAQGGLQIISDPSGAQVWMRDFDAPPGASPRSGKLLGSTPLSLTDVPSGKHRLVLTYEDWRPIQRTVEVMAGEAVKLEFAWKRGLVNFVSDPPGAEVYMRGERVGTLEDRTPFQWEFPEGDYPFRAVLPDSELDGVSVDWSVRADVDNEARFAFGYGSVSILTDPPGATVLANDDPVGTTPFVEPLVKPGQYAYSLRMDNYSSTAVSGEVVPGQELSFNVKLKFDPNPEPGQDFTNGVGMKMRWIDGLRGWVGAHETDQKAYESVMLQNPSYFRAPDKPVDSVSWTDAVKFCEKLTASEFSRRKLPGNYQYRLPNDEEWSYFAADAGLEDAITSRGKRRSGPDPVGASEPNKFGLYDVRGNVWEWCEDWYSTAILNRMSRAELVGNPSLAATEHKFVRGGSWSRGQDFELSIDWRSPMKPSNGDQADIGFRVVLMPGG